jgi:hypothetical protein
MPVGIEVIQTPEREGGGDHHDRAGCQPLARVGEHHELAGHDGCTGNLRLFPRQNGGTSFSTHRAAHSLWPVCCQSRAGLKFAGTAGAGACAIVRSLVGGTETTILLVALIRLTPPHTTDCRSWGRGGLRARGGSGR